MMEREYSPPLMLLWPHLEQCPVWGPACTGDVYTLQRLQWGATKMVKKLGCMAQEKPTLSTAKTSLRDELTAGPLHYLQGSPPPKKGT